MLRISTVVDFAGWLSNLLPLEVLRISTVVDHCFSELVLSPLEVLRISTVVDADVKNKQNRALWKC